jgi:ABC-type cobalt transport system substrate-binding protein
MKKTDVAMIVLIASVSVLIAFFVTRAAFGGAANEPAEYQTIDRIEPDLGEINTTIFSQDAINPAVEVQLAPGNQ